MSRQKYPCQRLVKANYKQNITKEALPELLLCFHIYLFQIVTVERFHLQFLIKN